MWTPSLIVTVMAVIAVDGQTANYSAVCVNNTMAIYPPIGPMCYSSPGVGPYSTGVSDVDKVLIVNDHNAYRSRVAQGLETLGNPGPQPPATDMKKLVWDDELATMAQRWANQCTYAHDSCRNVDRFSVGQNIFRILSSAYSTSVNWTRPTATWYNEVSLFNSSNIAPFVFTSATSHYTTITWANTEFIGCAFTFYKSSLAAEAKVPYVKFFVCNYARKGNLITGTMYTAGTTCTNCPAGKVCSNGLCA